MSNRKMLDFKSIVHATVYFAFALSNEPWNNYSIYFQCQDISQPQW